MGVVPRMTPLRLWCGRNASSGRCFQAWSCVVTLEDLQKIPLTRRAIFNSETSASATTTPAGGNKRRFGRAICSDAQTSGRLRTNIAWALLAIPENIAPVLLILAENERTLWREQRANIRARSHSLRMTYGFPCPAVTRHGPWPPALSEGVRTRPRALLPPAPVAHMRAPPRHSAQKERFVESVRCLCTSFQRMRTLHHRSGDRVKCKVGSLRASRFM